MAVQQGTENEHDMDDETEWRKKTMKCCFDLDPEKVSCIGVGTDSASTAQRLNRKFDKPGIASSLQSAWGLGFHESELLKVQLMKRWMKQRNPRDGPDGVIELNYYHRCYHHGCNNNL